MVVLLKHPVTESVTDSTESVPAGDSATTAETSKEVSDNDDPASDSKGGIFYCLSSGLSWCILMLFLFLIPRPMGQHLDDQLNPNDAPPEAKGRTTYLLSREVASFLKSAAIPTCIQFYAESSMLRSVPVDCFITVMIFLQSESRPISFRSLKIDEWQLCYEIGYHVERVSFPRFIHGTICFLVSEVCELLFLALLIVSLGDSEPGFERGSTIALSVWTLCNILVIHLTPALTETDVDMSWGAVYKYLRVGIRWQRYVTGLPEAQRPRQFVKVEDLISV
ncbi:hypothetical protein KIPB_009980 [Kipferlia bialata]|uniref:Uncharacterized protein n=1 Tax=Kipferlia bialata TaxID=797122 RepID=A0A391NRX1_9EUKA|nr:hypothetical protein KIPB_009980 [Kipferlia bialata]|eukprot:g9980.t1